MDYVVSAFYSENDALSAISEKSKGFHVAIVEVRAGNQDGRFKFLERAKDLPTIMTSDVNCISTMMKCIAFLEKPLSKDKLQNIWQHLAYKAFNAGPKDENEQLIHLEEVGIKQEIIQNQEHNEEVSVENDKYPAPSTPQLKQGIRLVDNEDQTNLSTEKESVEHDGESKFVEITCDDHLFVDNIIMETNSYKSLDEGINKPSNNECCPDPKNDGKKQNEACEHPVSRSSKSGRRKIKVKMMIDMVYLINPEITVPHR
ncbi:unnamed protein product [Lactuca saligna]|uniref:Response regulatory domain-containing protein n=1 Tax=Lactuca saligna TaxID=75948 RepID=A0AA35UL15_LACSI|nr:unnamed protein product [Lactuca saligna]